MVSATLLATRAIAARFARQFVMPAVIIGYGVIAALLVLIGLLAHYYSAWWWLFAVPLGGISVIFVAITAAMYVIMRRLTPTMTKQQRQLAKQFVEEISGYSELIGVSRLFLAYRIIGDVIRKKPKSYITEVTRKPGELQHIFTKLRDSFQ